MKLKKTMHFEVAIGANGIQKNTLSTNMGAKQCLVELLLQALRMGIEIIHGDRNVLNVKKK